MPTLKRRCLVICRVTVKGDDEPDSKAMTTDVSLALPDTKPTTIAVALDAYLDQAWSSKPHTIMRTHAIKDGGQLYADIDDPRPVRG